MLYHGKGKIGPVGRLRTLVVDGRVQIAIRRKGMELLCYQQYGNLRASLFMLLYAQLYFLLLTRFQFSELLLLDQFSSSLYFEWWFFASQKTNFLSKRCYNPTREIFVQNGFTISWMIYCFQAHKSALSHNMLNQKTLIIVWLHSTNYLLRKWSLSCIATRVSGWRWPLYAGTCWKNAT